MFLKKATTISLGIFINQCTMAQTYTPDILKDGFEQTTLICKPDYEGAVTATLVRKNTAQKTNKAVLYIHGFNDYFFQKDMANRFVDKGFAFYALDLRKYGRSWLPHQKLNNLRRIEEYDEEIKQALHIIEQEGHSKVLLAGHSTGGLIVTYFAGRYNHPLISGVFANSPFYNFNLSWFKNTIGIPIASALGKIMPNQKINGGFSALYGEGLHKDAKGEWDYNLAWKPHVAPKVNFGFIRAIHKAQRQVQKGMVIQVPLLVAHAAHSANPTIWSDAVMSADIILNVKDIKKYAQRQKGNITILPVENGIHDLVLSEKETRENVYALLFEWAQNYL